MCLVSMSNTPKPSSYINIAADVNFLQRIICCNHDNGNTPADTPTEKVPSKKRTPISPSHGQARQFNFAEDIPVEIEEEVENTR